MVTHLIVRHFRTSIGLLRSHYDTLGISQSAAPADVKAAYYKKSMELHPDRARGNREDFEEVAKAYKTLSDPSMRKLYDRREGARSKNYDTRRSSGFKHQFGKTPVYDFDRWTRQHYGGVIKHKQMRTETAQMRDCFANRHENENVTMALLCLILLAAFVGMLDPSKGPAKRTERKRSANPEGSPQKKPPNDL